MLRPISAKYLLVVSVETYQDDAGQRYVEELWFKDIREHLKYLKSFTIACPINRGARPPNCVSIQDELASDLQIVDLPNPSSFLKGVLALPLTVKTLWRAIGRSDIVHTSVAGWPIPLGWVAIPIVMIRRKLSVIVVESAFWRITPGQHVTFRRLVRAWLSERFNRWCVSRASLSIFTQDQYRLSLLTNSSERGHVINASWIDKQDIVDRSYALEVWDRKSARALRILFAGRLVPGKGVLVLLDAINSLELANIAIELDILGEGELLDLCRTVSESLTNMIRLRLLGKISYGAEFKRIIQTYHAVVVPSITDEQPRIVFDAYSQAVPVLASDTDGLAACVSDCQTGRLVEPNNAAALAELLKWSSENIGELKNMGLAALSAADSLTHQEMHRRRWTLLQELLGTR